MNFVLIFLVVIWVTASGEMKTVEDLEETVEVLKETVEALQQELNFWKQKIESNEVKMKNIEAEFESNKVKMKNIEAKTEVNAENIKSKTEEIEAKVIEKNGNDTEDRLNYLEEMVKLNVIRSCQEMFEFGITTSDYYHIDSDGPLRGSQPFRVWCEFTEDGRAITEVLHNSEQTIEVEKCEEPGCYKHDIVYTAPEEQIAALIELSQTCHQTVRYDCLMAPLMDDNINLGFWNDRGGDPQYYWEGSHHGEHVCSCFYQPDGCQAHSSHNTTCNCDDGAPELKSDSGTITNKTALPIRSVQFGGLVYDLQQAFHTLGRLRCWGKVAFEEGTSCAAIKRSGHFYNGFYNVRASQDEHTQLVFCNMTASHGYEDNSGQTYIESSETHFDQVEEDITKIKSDISQVGEDITKINSDISQVGEDITKINSDISQVGEDITKINSEIDQVGEDVTKLNSEIGQVEEDVEAIKSEIAMRSTFCGYQYAVTSTGTLTYGSFLFESNNIPGASFDLGSGRFTAGAEGTYRVDLAIGQMFSSSSTSGSGIYIQHNGQDITGIHSHIYTTGSKYSFESGGRSVILHLEKDDYVSVRVGSVNSLYYITFCVSYEGV